MQELFVGVDGGATKSIIRVENAAGELIGQMNSGPANIRNSVTQSWQSINSALEKILLPQGIFIDDKHYRVHAGMGLAGSEVNEAYNAFLNQPNHFSTLMLTSDAHTACLGAHAGDDGAIITIGTGVVGYAIHEDKKLKVGGWGFPQDDLGSGAWLGLEAVKKTLQWLDGRETESGIAKAVYEHFDQQQNELIQWVNQANSTAFAEIAPLVVKQSQNQDKTAIDLLQQAAFYIERIAHALKLDTLKCALMGSLATHIQPYLSPSLQQCLIPSKNTAEAGAIMLIHNHFAKHRVQYA